MCDPKEASNTGTEGVGVTEGEVVVSFLGFLVVEGESIHWSLHGIVDIVWFGGGWLNSFGGGGLG